MCFVNDYDWFPEIQDESTFPATAPTRCDECGRTIEVGDEVFHIDQQQYEICHACDQGDCECPRGADGDPVCNDDEGCRCETPNYGETFAYDCCQDCRKFREAIRSAEIKAGCDDDQAEPAMPAMFEQIADGGRDEALKYWREAKRLHPELLASGYLRFIWHKCF